MEQAVPLSSTDLNAEHASAHIPAERLQWAIEARGLTKYYPMVSGWRELLGNRNEGICAVDNVSLRVKRGELFGLVGPNGAGKTTLIKMLTTLVLPSFGEISISGYDIRQEDKIKKTIGLATSDERSFYWRLTGRQNLRFFAGLHDIPAGKANANICKVLEQVDLKAVADKRFQTYSTGMRQRLAIARALLTDPKVVFMDEPTKGLDPLAANSLHQLIRQQLIEEFGITVFLTSHHLTEVEKICDRIAVMNEGNIQACGTMGELRRLLGPVEKYRIDAEDLNRDAAAAILSLGAEIQVSNEKGAFQIEFDKDCADERLMKVISVIQEKHGKIKSVACAPVSLDSVFQHLTQKAATAVPNTPSLGEMKGIDQFVAPQDRKVDTSADVAPALPQSNPPGLRKWISGKARATKALLVRDMLSETSYRFSFFMQIVEIFLTVSALFFLSQIMGQDTVGKYLAAYGGNYFTFAIIGVAFYGYFNVGFSIFANQLRDAQMSGTLEAMLSTPTGLSMIVLGSSTWKFIMTTFRVLMILLSGALLMGGGMGSGSIALVFLIMIMTVISASSFGIIAACFIIVVKKGDPISYIFKAASWLMGGVVFPVAVLPNWMQKLALLLPTTHALQALRMVMLKGRGITEIRAEMIALSLFCFVLLPISLRTLRYAVRRAKREGSLTHY